ncbi:hypothetical protein E1A91_D06G033900v1 [Gossypium mustelinum]|uniref:Uncharacterized protein n=1 Tax=Gossypium mustelinum TaxID=34275 RepID=A0A5D2UDU7_GOSMU|nr:hypothetical protein E1A91_D06G033900v1 [Gossypium mustelinum]
MNCVFFWRWPNVSISPNCKIWCKPIDCGCVSVMTEYSMF